MLNTPSGTIEVSGLIKRFGQQQVLDGVDLHVAPERVVALLGPSGCGKTTLLRAIAGLERPDAGTIVVGGDVVYGPGLDVAPERRHIGMVFQDWALFPHLDVAGNVGYGLARKERSGPRVRDALELVGLGGMGDRQPGTLSGGQQQRVALARAIAPEPTVLLLDEPFSNLDTSLRVQVRSEIHQLLVELGITTVFVTHDQEEAFVLGDDVAVMSAGRIVQQATPAELYARPATPWVAEFVGDANLVRGAAEGGTALTVVGAVPLALPRTGPATVLLRPEELRLAVGGEAVIELIEYYGHDTVYLVRPPKGLRLRVRAPSAPQHQRGDAVTVTYAGPPAVSYSDRDEDALAGEGADTDMVAVDLDGRGAVR
ncbi:MAG: ABC transporter ATP-binding protein [Acidimicrobiales bacterium]